MDNGKPKPAGIEYPGRMLTVESRMRRLCLCSLLLSCLGVASVQAEFEAVRLPEPTGTHPVGTVTYYWEDETRPFSYSSFAGDNRKIIVQIWFPAETDTQAMAAPYSAVSADYRHVEANSTLSPAFSPMVSKAPVVLISPGRGVERFGYTTIAEDLASHGYVVAAVDMPGIGYVIYPEGYIVRPNPQFQPSRELMSGPYEKVDEFFEEPTEIGRLDLEFALENIKRLRVALESSTHIVRAFFDTYLRGKSGFLETTTALDNVVVTDHSAPESPKSQ